MPFVIVFVLVLAIPHLRRRFRCSKTTEAKLPVYSTGVPNEIRTSDRHRRNSSMTGVNAVLVSAAAYIGSIASFLLASFIPQMPNVPIGCLLPSNNESFRTWSSSQAILIALFGFHFTRRAFEVFFVHKYQRSQTVLDSVGAQMYYWGFSFWIGWSIRPDAGFENTYLPLFVIGATLFCIGETGNCIAHVQLRILRNPHPDSEEPVGHVIPRNVIFTLVSCPHYTFELVTWLGFVLATWVIASMTFLLATFITLMVYSRRNHQRYLREFDGLEGRELYPTRRKALIPFIY